MLMTSRLWYQLTISILEFLALPQSYPFQISLYHSFIKDFENKINSLKLVEIAVTVSQRYTGERLPLQSWHQRTCDIDILRLDAFVFY